MTAQIYRNTMAGGKLPSATVSRPAAKDYAGNDIALDTLRYGPTRLTGPMPAWTHDLTTASVNFVCAATGFDRDGANELMVAYDSSQDEIWTWQEANGDDTNTAKGSLGNTWDITKLDHSTRGVSMPDIRTIDSTWETDIAHEPYAVVVLPGCIVFACERSKWTGAAWQVNGISMFALQHNAAMNAWTLTKIKETLAGGVNVGQARGLGFAMSAYYPMNIENPLLKAMIPVADYQDAVGTDGGELFLLKATRSSSSVDWSFTGTLIYSLTGNTDAHFHGAAWTPRGMVLAIGDNIAGNKNILFTSTDWDGDLSTNVTTVDNWHGDFTNKPGNQWVGACPGRDINTFICTADQFSETIYELTVPATIADGAAYKRLFGSGPTEFFSGANQLKINAWDCNRPHPESSSRVISKQWQENGTLPDDQFGRILFSPDAINWMAVGRFTNNVTHSAPHTIFRNKIVELGAGGSADGVWTMPIPTTIQAAGGAVAPGGENEVLSSLDVNFAYGTNTAAVITTPADAPGYGKVIRMTGDASNSAMCRIRPKGASDTWDSFGKDNLVMVGYVYVEQEAGGTDAGLNFRARIGGSTQTFKEDRHVTNTRGQWQKVVFVFDATHSTWQGAGPTNIWTPLIDIYQDSATAFVGQFLFQFEGLYWDQPTAFPIDPQATPSTKADEQLKIPLEGLTNVSSIALSLTIPEDARDGFGILPPSLNTTLATLWGDASNYTEIIYNAASNRIDITATGGGGGTISLTGPTVAPASSLKIARLDQIDIMVSFNGTNMQAAAIVGGQFVDMANMVGSVANVPTQLPTEIRIGSNDFGVVPNVEVNRVAIHPAIAYTTVAQMNTLLWTGAEFNGPDLARFLNISIEVDELGSGTPTPIVKVDGVGNFDMDTLIGGNDLVVSSAIGNMLDLQNGSYYQSAADSQALEIPAGGDFSFEFWIIPDDPGGTDYILAKTNNTAIGWGVYITGSAGAERFVWNLSGPSSAPILRARNTPNGSALRGFLHQVIGVHKHGIGETIYLDGAAVALGGFPLTTAAKPGGDALPFTIGASSTGGFRLAADSKRIRTWSQALTALNAATLWNNGKGLAFSQFGGGGGGRLVPIMAAQRRR